MDFRAILKSKVPMLTRLDKPSFEQIYQNFAQKVKKHGLANVNSLYAEAGESANATLVAIQERAAQQVATPSGPKSGRKNYTVGGGTTVNVFSPEASRAPASTGSAVDPASRGGPSPTAVDTFSPEVTRTGLGTGTTSVDTFSPELARAQPASPAAAGDPALRGGAGPVASPEALRTNLGSGTTLPNTSPEMGRGGLGAGTVTDTFSPELGRAVGAQTPPPSSPEANRTGLGAGTTGRSTVDQNMLAMAERAGAGTTQNTFSPESMRGSDTYGRSTDSFSPEATRTPPPASVGTGLDNFKEGAQYRTPSGLGNFTEGAQYRTPSGLENFKEGAQYRTPSGLDNFTEGAQYRPSSGLENFKEGAQYRPSSGLENFKEGAQYRTPSGLENFQEGAQYGTPSGGGNQANTSGWTPETWDAYTNGTPPANGGGGMPPAGGGTGGGGVPPAGGGTGGGGVPPAGGGVPPTAGFNAPTDLTGQINTAYDTLAQTTKDQFGTLQTQDFSDQIRALVESGRVSLNELNAQQLATLQQSEQRRMGQIGDIQGQLQGDLNQQEQYRQDIQRQVAEQAATRAGQMTADQQARIQASRGALGGQVTSEFEEVAALTGGLTGSQALSTTAGMDRLAQVANQGAAQRLAAPAQLAAEAKMAVGDEKFRLENQLAQSLSEGMAELNIQEQQQVMQEAMRQEQFGIERDQALAQALTNIAGQRTGATLNEAGRLEDISQRQGEITQQQAYQTGESIAQRDWQSREAGLQRDWQGQQAVDDRDWRELQAIAEQNWRSQERKDQQRWQGTQALNQYNWGELSAEAQRDWQTNENKIQADARLNEYETSNLLAAEDYAAMNAEEAPPDSVLGVLERDYPDVDDGLKMIALSLSFMNKDAQDEALARYAQPGPASAGQSGSRAMSQEDIAVLEAMMGFLIPRLTEEAGLEYIPNNPSGIDYRVEQQNRVPNPLEYPQGAGGNVDTTGYPDAFSPEAIR